MTQLIPIDEVHITPINAERTFHSHLDGKVHHEVAEMYFMKEYDKEPKTAAEAKEKGVTGFNGMNSSFPTMKFYKDVNRTIFSADIMPTRYLIGQAMRDVMKDGSQSEASIEELSPNMANVSLMAPVKINGKYFLFSQIKGAALGSGQIHAGYVAGNIAGKHVIDAYNNPNKNILVSAMKQEVLEEAGIELNSIDSTSPAYFVDERETGRVNIASVVRNANADKMLLAYQDQTIIKLNNNEKLEVGGVAMLPIAGIALIPIENNNHKVEDITCYVPTELGLDKIVDTKGIRPYTRIVLEHLENKENRHILLEKAGF
ncbi:MAG: hypothetical protein ABH828_04335 [archaeon]